MHTPPVAAAQAWVIPEAEFIPIALREPFWPGAGR